jgi:hypothetical protein
VWTWVVRLSCRHASELILCNFFSPFARAFVRKYVTRLRLVFIYTTIKPFVTSETFSEITPARREIIIDNFATTIGQESSFHTLIIFLSHSRWFILLIGKQKTFNQSVYVSSRISLFCFSSKLMNKSEYSVRSSESQQQQISCILSDRARR